MSDHLSNRPRLAIPASTVAFGPARALTSHLRRRYESRYRGRYRFSRSAFLFDVILLGLVAGLIVTNLVFALLPPPPPSDVRLSVFAPDIITAAPQAFEAHLISNTDKEVNDVRLRWDLPPNTEILSADPPLTGDREAFIGTVKPGETKVARIAVRVYAPPGSVKVGFSVKTRGRKVIGEMIRPIKGTGLTFEPLIDPRYLAADATIPFILRNTTTRLLEAVDIVALQGTTVDGRDHRLFDALPPSSTRIVFLKANDQNFIKVQAQVRGVSLEQYENTVEIDRQPLVSSLKLTSKPEESQLIVEVESEKEVKLLVSHPALKDGKEGMQILTTSGKKRHVLSLTGWVLSSWFAVPFVEGADGLHLGALVAETHADSPDVSMSARYYSAEGDQIGVGPIPPQVGQTTTYWLQWKVTPGSTDVEKINLSADLMSGVRLTGRQALPQGGTLSQAGNKVIWSIGALPAGADPYMIAFEIALTPTEAMRGTVPIFLEQVVLEYQNVGGVVGPGLDANLMGDPKAEGKGTVE